ncbi:Chitinase 1 [Entomortierella chlamydospora]|uniref:chitinase n=1 Tax=Entomortierella chlamydospora TaxID=101097 RepID=A0A9P6T150_9FUNG|nr:Chitinase 1 [Entomortierella chlamydospora]
MIYNCVLLYILMSIAFIRQSVSAFNPHSKSNVVNYWGQGLEESLSEYCSDDTIDIFALAFVFDIMDGMPILNLGGHCSGTIGWSSVLDCSNVGKDIKTCQKRGKAVVISIGGAVGSYSLPDSKSGRDFADKVWDMFLGGSSDTRPFGDTVLDGVDLDLESGQTEGYVAFIQALRKKFKSSHRNYYITGAPQCPYPDQATGDALAHAWFDFVWVQFYNNYCGVQSFGSSNFNFETWNNWAKTVSVNKDVKILLGVPGGPGAAGSGVVDSKKLVTILKSLRSYSHFGGVMMWDAGSARQSGLASAASKLLHGSSSSKSDSKSKLKTQSRRSRASSKRRLTY